MTYCTLSTIDNIPDDSLLLAWAEVFTLATGQFVIDDLSLDREVILRNLEILFPDEDVEALSSEPGVAWDRVTEDVELRIATEADRTQEDIGFQYPFEVRPDAGIVLTLRDDFTSNPLGASYLLMQMEQLYRSKLLKFWDHEGNDADGEFLTPYRRVFEILSAISVAKFKNGVPILIGESRSVRGSLIPAIQEVCGVIGNGRAKTYEALNSVQKAANDGGVDAIIIHKDDQQVFECVMVGATTQQSSLRNKMMGPDRRRRVENYFVDATVLGPQSGALTHSNPFDEGVYGRCNEVGCLYLSREKIVANLFLLEFKERRQRRCFLQTLKALVEPMRKLSEIRVQIEFDQFELPCAD